MGRRGKRGASAQPADQTAGAERTSLAAEPTGGRREEKDARRAVGATAAGRKPSCAPRTSPAQTRTPIEGPALTTGRRPEVSVDVPKRKLILVTEDPSELRVALVEDGRLAEIYFERPEKRSYLGDIYRGKVENVLAGIDAAFVDFGLDKNGFLYVDEVRTGEGDRRGRRIGEVLKQGQDVVVQVMKDPMGSKGARLTMHISLAGRYVVYVPGGSGVGVSRRLGAERARAPARALQGTARQERRPDRAHRGRRRGSGGDPPRRALPFAPLVAPQEEGRDGAGPRARPQGSRHRARGDP